MAYWLTLLLFASFTFALPQNRHISGLPAPVSPRAIPATDTFKDRLKQSVAALNPYAGKANGVAAQSAVAGGHYLPATDRALIAIETTIAKSPYLDDATTKPYIREAVQELRKYHFDPVRLHVFNLLLDTLPYSDKTEGIRHWYELAEAATHEKNDFLFDSWFHVLALYSVWNVVPHRQELMIAFQGNKNFQAKLAMLTLQKRKALSEFLRVYPVSSVISLFGKSSGGLLDKAMSAADAWKARLGSG